MPQTALNPAGPRTRVAESPSAQSPDGAKCASGSPRCWGFLSWLVAEACSRRAMQPRDYRAPSSRCQSAGGARSLLPKCRDLFSRSLFSPEFSTLAAIAWNHAAILCSRTYFRGTAYSPGRYFTPSHRRRHMPYPPGHRTEVKKKIIASARRLFNKHGFDNVSISQIMAGAGLTHGGFYSYFESKSDLYAEVLGCFFTDPERKSRWEGVEVDLSAGDVGPQVVRAYLSRQHFEDVE